MPYALIDPVDGEVPGHKYVPEDYEPEEGEEVVADAYFIEHQGGLWDAAKKDLRDPTDAEVLDRARAEKKTELQSEFDERTSGQELAASLVDPESAPADRLRVRLAALEQAHKRVDRAKTIEDVGEVSL